MIANVLIGVLVIGFILYRQMRPMPVGGSPKTAVVLTVIGAVTALETLQHSAFTPADIALLVGSTAVGVAIAVVRAYSVTLYRDAETGTTMGRGTAVTAGLWLLGIATHIGIDALATAGLGGSTLLFYLGSVLLVQNLVVTVRARQAGPAITAGRTARGEKNRSVSAHR